MDRKFVVTALSYALVGLALGIFMAATKNHAQFVTHAHSMLIGFLLSFVYALCHKLWLGNTGSGLAVSQFWLHQAGAFVLLLALFLLYGQFVEEDKLEPVLAIASIAVFLGVLLMTVLFAKTKAAA